MNCAKIGLKILTCTAGASIVVGGTAFTGSLYLGDSVDVATKKSTYYTALTAIWSSTVYTGIALFDSVI